jgi:hypothetical protein
VEAPLCVPSIGSITQIAAASGLLEPRFLAEEAVGGETAGQALDDEVLAGAVRLADEVLSALRSTILNDTAHGRGPCRQCRCPAPRQPPARAAARAGRLNPRS